MLGQANPTDGPVRSAIGAHGPIGDIAKTISITQSFRIAGALFLKHGLEWAVLAFRTAVGLNKQARHIEVDFAEKHDGIGPDLRRDQYEKYQKT